MRPTDPADIAGQDRRAIAGGKLRSLILWGPPGCGKTTLARALVGKAGMPFVALSAVLDGVPALRAAIERAELEKRMSGRPTCLFVDEIHRWSKSQQDALLPHVESGLLVLIGATTENPSFELNAALRSRVRIVRLAPLTEEEILDLLRRAVADPRGLAGRVRVEAAALARVARLSGGDARRALDDLERSADALPDGGTLDEAHLARTLDRADIRHDASGTDHYDVLSALIKSLRGSDPDAALYWLARMLEGGEDPVGIARRLMIFASEDVGNADPRGLQVAVAAAQAAERIGMPEVRIVLGQAVTWLATCPKSNAAYLGIDAALADVREYGPQGVPPHLRSAAIGYTNPHEQPHRITDQPHLPDRLVGRRYYEPSGQGEEKLIAERMAWWNRKKSGR